MKEFQMYDTTQQNIDYELDQSLIQVKQELMNLEHGDTVTVPMFELRQADIDRSQDDQCERFLGIDFDQMTNEPIQAYMIQREPHMAFINDSKDSALDSLDVSSRNNFSLADFLVNNNLEPEFNKEDEN